MIFLYFIGPCSQNEKHHWMLLEKDDNETFTFEVTQNESLTRNLRGAYR